MIPSPSLSVKIQICFQKFVDNIQQCFALLPQVNFPSNNLNFHWKSRWWDQIQAIFLNLFYFISMAYTRILVWPQWWSWVDVSQQEVDFNKKSSKIKKIFWFDFHWCSHGPSNIGHHFRKQSGSKIEVFKKWQ